nr:MAG TPA: major capsid protein [Caudoviricetes sp.]
MLAIFKILLCIYTYFNVSGRLTFYNSTILDSVRYNT